MTSTAADLHSVLSIVKNIWKRVFELNSHLKMNACLYYMRQLFGHGLGQQLTGSHGVDFRSFAPSPNSLSVNMPPSLKDLRRTF